MKRAKKLFFFFFSPFFSSLSSLHGAKSEQRLRARERERGEVEENQNYIASVNNRIESCVFSLLVTECDINELSPPLSPVSGREWSRANEGDEGEERATDASARKCKERASESSGRVYLCVCAWLMAFFSVMLLV